MAEYNWNIKTTTKNFGIMIAESDNYGYFEHHIHGDGCGGGLWFDGKELIDYDGVSDLPKEVARALKEQGFDVSYVEEAGDEC